MTRPDVPPIGQRLSGTAKVVSRAFDDALAAEGGSVPVWLILITLKSRRIDNQRALAEAVGIQGATLTHHLNAMEKDGLITRHRDPANRRVHVVELTEQGESAFSRMRKAAVAFDRRLRSGLTEDEIARLTDLLERMRDNVSDDPEPC